MSSHTHETKQNRFVLSLALTRLIFLAELLGGLWTGSLALLADAAHVFMDAFALGLSYLALRAAALPADDRHTYGYHRLQILAALTNGITLLFIAFEILREAWERWQQPQPIQTGLMPYPLALRRLNGGRVAGFHQHRADVDGPHHCHASADMARSDGAAFLEQGPRRFLCRGCLLPRGRTDGGWRRSRCAHHRSAASCSGCSRRAA